MDFEPAAFVLWVWQSGLESLTYFGTRVLQSYFAPFLLRFRSETLHPSDFTESARCNGKSHRQRGNGNRAVYLHSPYTIYLLLRISLMHLLQSRNQRRSEYSAKNGLTGSSKILFC